MGKKTERMTLLPVAQEVAGSSPVAPAKILLSSSKSKRVSHQRPRHVLHDEPYARRIRHLLFQKFAFDNREDWYLACL